MCICALYTQQRRAAWMLRSLLRGMARDAREVLGQPRQRQRSRGEVDDEEPGGEDVDEVV